MRHNVIKKMLVSGILLVSLVAAGSVGLSANRIVSLSSPQTNVSASLVSAPLDLVVTDAHTDSIGFFSGKGDGSFGNRLNYDAGFAPNGVVASDFNKDGNLDCAVADMNGSSVAVLLGDGLGHFGTPVLFPAGTLPCGIVTEDFNQDGNLDLAVTNQNDSTVSVLYGNGNGTFGGRHDYPVGTGPAGIVSVDFDKDGFFDLAVTDSYEATIGVLLANGTHGFGSCLFYPLGVEITDDPEGLVVGDFNNDTIVDLALAIHNTNSIGVYFGDGFGGLSGINYYFLGTIDGPFGIAAGDFNEDGKLDVAVTNEHANTVSILFGDGAGNFSSRHDFPVGLSPVGIIAVRLTADDDLDLAVTNYDSACVSILLGDGTGLFDHAANLTTGLGPTGLAAGTFRYDTTNPMVQITKPVNGIYLMNLKILPFPRPLIFGRIDIQVSASDAQSGINHVEFYIDSTLVNTSTTEPYQWTWRTFSLGKHVVRVVAFDNADNSVQTEIQVRKFL